MHDDIWFLHIVIYQYWLWFFFIFLIVFFFITFLSTLRWSNLRMRPSRETRGVSRSKCGDLITATVPVSWATSIIIHESTDAIEFSDGFGTTELAVGIRAYQWGWEYYYPKDLISALRPADSNLFLGHSALKLNLSSNSTRAQERFRIESLFCNTSTSSNFTTLPLPLRTQTPSLDAFTSMGGNSNLQVPTSITPTSRFVKLGVSDDLVYDTPLGFNTSLNPVSGDFGSISYLTKLRPNYTPHGYNFLSKLALFNYCYNYDNFQLNLPNSYNYLQKTNSLFFNITAKLLNPVSALIAGVSVMGLRISDTLSEDFTFNKFTGLGPELSSQVQIYNPVLDLDFAKKLNYMSSLVSFINADQDFKRWSSQDLLEDAAWSSFINSNDAASLLTSKRGLDLTTEGDLYLPSGKPARYLNFSRNPFKLSVNSDSPLLGSTSSAYPRSLFAFKPYLISSWVNSWLDQTASGGWYINQLSTSLTFNKSGFNLISFGTNRLSATSFFEILTSFTLGAGLSMAKMNDSVFGDTFLSPQISSIVTAAKGLNIYSQAFQKVFKTTIEEERLSALFKNLSSTRTATPLISTSLPSLLGSLTKNSSLFSDLTLSYPQFSKTRWAFGSLNSLLLSPLYEFPFAPASQSDIIRYLWFDWYSVRGSLSAKAMDTSVFGLHGAKYLSYAYSNLKPQVLNQVDNFFNKYNHARKFYIPMSTYTPLVFDESTLRSNTFNYLIATKGSTLSLLGEVSSLNKTSGFLFWIWGSNYTPYKFSGSADQTYVKNLTRNLNISFDHVTSVSRLSNILATREFIFRNFTSSFRLQPNSLLLESSNRGHSSSILIDVKSTIASDNMSLFNLGIGNLFRLEKSPLTSQYQPLRKGIANMIRIQADKAIAMPVETRLQILAVSKDIIHSWSIPSAGIKIDCIPGYSSHRVAIFLVSGIYWGQCMEICGRFHHWMPIVVYFMKRDLFCLWCSHFILSTTSNSGVEHSTAATSRLGGVSVTYQPSSWVYEY